MLRSIRLGSAGSLGIAAVIIGMLVAATGARAEPVPQPTATATPAAQQSYTRYIALDLAFAPSVSNALVPANTSARVTGQVRGVLEYHLLGNRFVQLETHDWTYAHPTSAVGIDNATDARFFNERQTTLDTGIIGTQRTFFALSNVLRTNSYGAPKLGGVLGFGIESLPNFDRPATLSGSVFYYSDVHGTLATANGPLDQSYKLFTYQADAALTRPGRPLFLEIGIIGDHYIPKAFAPVGMSHRAAQLGIGYHW